MKKVRLMIELTEEDYHLLKIRTECFDLNENTRLIQAVRNGTPYNPTGDCISREALKDEVRKHAEYYADRTEEDRYNVGYTECACEILDFIDNAPPVETFTLEDMQNNFDAGVDSVIGKYDKAKGEWSQYEFHDLGAFGDWDYKCSNCGKVNGGRSNFCPNCGANMKGGAE